MRTNKSSKQLKSRNNFENLLRSRLAELKSHLDQLRQDLVVEDEIDDEATQATRNGNRDLVVLTMDREIRNISEIEQALERIARNEYGAVKRQSRRTASKPSLGHDSVWTVPAEESTESSNASLGAPHLDRRSRADLFLLCAYPGASVEIEPCATDSFGACYVE
ncbi:MAG TPA: hypothetical protein VIX91_28315 [Candidatus Acidoferrum sp.]